jgi:hypothetical protein
LQFSGVDRGEWLLDVRLGPWRRLDEVKVFRFVTRRVLSVEDEMQEVRFVLLCRDMNRDVSKMV